MDFLFKREFINEGDFAIVECSDKCYIDFMDDQNFSNYKNGDDYNAFGSFFEEFPAKLAAPYSGHWNVVLEFPQENTAIKHTISFLKK